MRADGQTERRGVTKLIVGFGNFGNASKKGKLCQIRKLALPSTSFPNHYSLIILACEVTQPVPLTVSYKF
jgi:hypothetical protein